MNARGGPKLAWPLETGRFLASYLAGSWPSFVTNCSQAGRQTGLALSGWPLTLSGSATFGPIGIKRFLGQWSLFVLVVVVVVSGRWLCSQVASTDDNQQANLDAIIASVKRSTPINHLKEEEM